MNKKLFGGHVGHRFVHHQSVQLSTIFLSVKKCELNILKVLLFFWVVFLKTRHDTIWK